MLEVDRILAESFPVMASDGSQGVPSLVFVSAPRDVVVYTTIRSFEQRIEIAPEKLVAEIRSDYQRVLGLRRVERRVFDAIAFAEDLSFAVLAADFPRDAPADFYVPSLSYLRHQLKTLAGEMLVPQNMFIAIDGIYRQAEGQVVEMSFSTGRSTKRERMRLGGQCLRREAYHVGGSNAVNGDIEIYHIAVRWQRVRESLKGELELTLHGLVYLLHKPAPVLDVAVLRNGLFVSDLLFTAAKIRQLCEQRENH
jgi:hypothetical protein